MSLAATRRNLPGYLSDTIYPYYSLSFAWRGGRAENARAERSKKRKNAPSVGNKLPTAPHGDGEPKCGNIVSEAVPVRFLGYKRLRVFRSK